LQQYLPQAAVSNRSKQQPYSITSSARASSAGGTEAALENCRAST
jgi:hypothetical protein